MNERQNRPSNSGDNVTFDYNQLYANTSQPTTPIVQTPIPEIPVNQVIQETPIVLESDKENQTDVVTSFIPTFDTRALESNDETNMTPSEELISSIKSDKQQENEEYKKNIIFILAFFGVIMFAILFIFPLIAGY